MSAKGAAARPPFSVLPLHIRGFPLQDRISYSNQPRPRRLVALHLSQEGSALSWRFQP
ncbi:hypothetical protein HNQ75_004511 [Rhizobium flavum]|uniref:Uncharacterized protein n=1 Tax=Pseudorhizobium flavum TaxID=1335061 RepID=A0A7X0DF22_9HYPH|nr:hypothetical protein [Pseudorhizobium flavum]CAD6630857.1 hypothetical protein RFYW14_04390 [Pseudorhizobium flavum]